MPAAIDYQIEPESLDKRERQAIDACAVQFGAGTTLIVKRDAEGQLVIEVGGPQRQPARA